MDCSFWPSHNAVVMESQLVAVINPVVAKPLELILVVKAAEASGDQNKEDVKNVLNNAHEAALGEILAVKAVEATWKSSEDRTKEDAKNVFNIAHEAALQKLSYAHEPNLGFLPIISNLDLGVLPGVLPGGMPGGMPGVMPGGMPSGMLGVLPGVMPGGMPSGMLGEMPSGMLYGMDHSSMANANSFGNPKASRFSRKREHPLVRAFKLNSTEEVRAILQDDDEAATEPFWDLGFETPLFWALKLQCCSDIVRLLLAHGATANSTDMDGRTPIQVVESQKATSQEQKYGACPNADMNLSGAFGDNLHMDFGWGQPAILSGQAKWCDEMRDLFLDQSGLEVD